MEGEWKVNENELAESTAQSLLRPSLPSTFEETAKQQKIQMTLKD